MEAPTTPRDALVKKRLREFINVSPDFPFILIGSSPIGFAGSVYLTAT
jgi:hypothetical protein